MKFKETLTRQFFLIKKNKNITDLISNYISVFILGFTGIVLNIIIAKFYSPSILGIFNQSLTLYFLISFIGSWGINYSVLESIPKVENNKKEIESIILGSIISTLLCSFIITFIYSNLIDKVAIIFNSENLKKGLFSIIPAIFFGSFNKVFLFGILNGLRRMKEFAIIQSLRYLIILLGLFIFINIPIEGCYLPIIVSFSEIIIFLIMLFKIITKINFLYAKNFLRWSYRHLVFGTKAVFTGFLSEANTKVDVLMIGFLLNDKDVGIYSFASLFIEGFITLIKVMQNVYNPIFSKIAIKNNINKVTQMTTKIKNTSYFLSIIFAIFLIFFYFLFIKLIISNQTYLESFEPFLILMIGITLSSGYLPFFEIFSMAKFPALNSLFFVCFFFFNFSGNFILIPHLGINGAALATAFSYIFSSCLLSYFSKKFLKIFI